MVDLRTWKSRELSHEGFPLMLRYPEKLNVEDRKDQFPTLAVVTHQFSKSSPNGLPDPDYNDTLLQLDSDIRSAFEKPGFGCTVLVETFGGKRQYYIYVTNNIDVGETLSDVVRNNSGETLSWLTRPDQEWNFISQYRQQYLDP